MKTILNFLFFLWGIALLHSCQDENVAEMQTKDSEESITANDNSTFLVFSSKEDLKRAIDLMKEGHSSTSVRKKCSIKIREVKLEEGGCSDPNFQSLLEVQKQLYLSKLTQAQLDSINTDEDDLEFCLEDSIIADYEFAQLLNSKREIQVNDTIYRYFGNGVAFAPSINAKKIQEIDNEVANIKLNEHNIGKELSLNNNVKFIPLAYRVEFSENSSQSTSFNDPRRASITLKNGFTIPAEKIRDVNYKSKGDGSWLFRTWNQIWGKNVLAINHFSKKKRLRLNFYDQNYIVYANIGTSIRMQKRIVGCWWNCKAEELRLGWTAIELKHTLPKPMITYINPNIKPNSAQKSDYPSFMKHNFPFKNEEVILFHLPFPSYDLKVKDLNVFLKSGIKKVAQEAPRFLQNFINNTKEEQRGLYSANKNVLYVVTGPEEIYKNKKHSIEKKFYAQWFPGEYLIGFGFNNSFKLNSVKFDGGKSTKLSRGIVYGAVKYNGQWLAARITKEE